MVTSTCRRVSIMAACLILVSIAAILMVVNLCIGDVSISPDQLWQLLTAQKEDTTGLAAVIKDVRLPRTLAAALVGLALSSAGYLLQRLSRNDLADPYLTGVASGAALGAAFAMFGGVPLDCMPLAAFVGGAAASLIVIRVARAGAASLSDAGISIPRLLLSGIALSSIATAAINLFMQLLEGLGASQGLSLWLMGGISGKVWGEIGPAALAIALALIVALASTRQLRLLSLGTEQAASLGLDVKKSQLLILGAAVLLTAAAVSLSGLVGFVGLIGPQIARRLVKDGEKARIIASALSGAILTMAADLCARSILGGQELPLGSLMALTGGPVFILLLLKNLDRVKET